VANPDQKDGEDDGIGDACDPCPTLRTLVCNGRSTVARAETSANTVYADVSVQGADVRCGPEGKTKAEKIRFDAKLLGGHASTSAGAANDVAALGQLNADEGNALADIVGAASRVDRMSKNATSYANIADEHARPDYIKAYNTRTDPACGVALWKLGTDKWCPPLRYNTGTDAALCGTHKPTYTRAFHSCPRGAHSGSTTCNTGDRKLSESSHSGGPCTDRDGIERNLLVTEAICEQATPVANTCENRAFGVAEWSLCRDWHHGVDTYATCPLPEFGVSEYYPCYLTASPVVPPGG
jgi:hypothetical protein